MSENNNIPQFMNSESFMSDKNYVRWLSDLKKRIRIAQLKAAVRVNEEMLKLYWGLGEDICEKQKQHHWGTAFIKRLSVDLRTEFPHTEGFSWSNLYKIRQWYLYYSAQIEFLYQAGGKLEITICDIQFFRLFPILLDILLSPCPTRHVWLPVPLFPP